MIGHKLVRGDPGYDSELDEETDDESLEIVTRKQTDKYGSIELFNGDECSPTYYKELFIDPEFDLSLETVSRLSARDILDVVKNLIKARSA